MFKKELKEAIDMNSATNIAVKEKLDALLSYVSWDKWCKEHSDGHRTIVYDENSDFSIIGMLKRIELNLISFKDCLKDCYKALDIIKEHNRDIYSMVSTIYDGKFKNLGECESTEIFVYKSYRADAPEIYMNGTKVDCNKAKSVTIYFNEGELPQISIEK